MRRENIERDVRREYLATMRKFEEGEDISIWKVLKTAFKYYLSNPRQYTRTFLERLCNKTRRETLVYEWMQGPQHLIYIQNSKRRRFALAQCLYNLNYRLLPPEYLPELEEIIKKNHLEAVYPTKKTIESFINYMQNTDIIPLAEIHRFLYKARKETKQN